MRKTTRNVSGLLAGVVLVAQVYGAAWAGLEEGVAAYNETQLNSGGLTALVAHELLVRAKGISERQALKTMLVKLRSVQAFQARGNPNAPGHRPPNATRLTDI